MMSWGPHPVPWDPSPAAMGPPPSAWDSPRVLWVQQSVPHTPTLCLGPPRCHGTPPGCPPLPWAPPQAAGAWGQTELRTERTGDTQLSTHGCPDCSRPSSPVLGAPKPWPLHAPHPQQPPWGAPTAPWGQRVLRRGAPRGAHLAQHPQPSTLGAHPQERWVQGGHGGGVGDTGAVAHGSVSPRPTQSCTKCTAPQCSRAARATSPSPGGEGSGARMWGWRLGGLSEGDTRATSPPPCWLEGTRGRCRYSAPQKRGGAAPRWPPVFPGHQ